jgi:hypothetical protein
MNKLSRTLLKGPMLAALVIFCAAITTRAQTARLQLSQLDPLAKKATETLDINVDERLMQLTAKFLGHDPDDEEVRKVITGLKGIYVKSFEFENPGEYTEADLESIRTQVRNTSWTRIMHATSKKDGEIEVYLMTNGSQVGGLVVIAAETKELTVVNVLGDVNLEKLTKLEGNFGVPDLDIDDAPKPKQRN